MTQAEMFRCTRLTAAEVEGMLRRHPLQARKLDSLEWRALDGWRGPHGTYAVIATGTSHTGALVRRIDRDGMARVAPGVGRCRDTEGALRQAFNKAAGIGTLRSFGGRL